MWYHLLFRPQITERVWKGTRPLASLQVSAFLCRFFLTEEEWVMVIIIHRGRNKLSGQWISSPSLTNKLNRLVKVLLNIFLI